MAQKNADFRDGYSYRKGGKLTPSGKPNKDINKEVERELTKNVQPEVSQKGEAKKTFTGNVKKSDNKALSLQGDTAGHDHYDYSDGPHSGYSKK